MPRSGKTYYFNKLTGQTVREKPEQRRAKKIEVAYEKAAAEAEQDESDVESSAVDEQFVLVLPGSLKRDRPVLIFADCSCR